jgi:hypothetical protein
MATTQPEENHDDAATLTALVYAATMEIRALRAELGERIDRLASRGSPQADEPEPATE